MSIGTKAKRKFFPSDRFGIGICLAISLVAWFLTKMSKEYLDEHDFNVRYEIPDHLTLEQLPVDQLSTELRAKGWAFLRMALTRKEDTLLLETGEYLQQNISSRLALANHLRDQVTDQIEIRSITPEQLSFKLVEKANKRVPVALYESLPLDGQHQLRDVYTFEPDSITIYGPEGVIRDVDFWPLRYEGGPLNADTQVSIPLKPTENGITFNTTHVMLVVPVEQITEKEIYVPIVLTDSLANKVQIFPDEALVRCTVGLSRFDEVTSSLFDVVASPNGSSSIYQVSVLKKPTFVELVSFSPRQVEAFRIHK